ncbi:M12 family metallo-peptidase [Cellvibrio fibrivorans]|jgi:hypothetical protein|uniref:Metallo-peptidase family M12B Reprolysin-like n=1 Tax=Cellvibrio fibrivorans TaxID=126350 RepID=A0ABU1UXP2_9GAMM|nr:M12 family metallo-peptidase [Cellvibrio fibrivorans]MDR7089966.1 hypothetical protein [Cellvibrio fibrivorans]
MKYVFMLLFVFFSNLSWAQNKVDVLVLYPDTVANVLGNNVAVQAANFINQGNSAFTKSNINIQLNLLDSVQISGYSNTACNSSVVSSLETNTEVTNLRRFHKPHVTILLCDSPTNNIAGNANYPSTVGSGGAPKALAVALYSHAYTFAHELGHILGVGHGKISGSTTHTGVPISTSMGYGVADNYRDVMTYPNAFGNAVQYLFFSNPAIKTCIGQTNTTCGTNEYNAAGGIPTVYTNYVSKYKSHWTNLQPTQLTTFKFDIPNPIGSMKIEMIYPTRKLICNPSYAAQIYSCEHKTFSSGQHIFQITGQGSTWKYESGVCQAGTDASQKTCAYNVTVADHNKTILMSAKYNGPPLPETTITFNANFNILGGGSTSLSLYDNGLKLCEFRYSWNESINTCTITLPRSNARLELRGSVLDRFEWSDHINNNYNNYGSCDPQDDSNYTPSLCNINNLNGTPMTKTFSVWVYD